MCISSQQYLLQTRVDLGAFECTLVESDNFYFVKVHFARYLELPCESFFFKPLNSLNIFGHAGKCPLFDDVQRDSEALDFSAQLCTTESVCTFMESSFWYQALQLFRIPFPQQQILNKPDS